LSGEGLGLSLDIVVPILMSCALLWWVSRGMNWTMRLTVTAITLVVIIAVLWFERSGFFRSWRHYDIGGAMNWSNPGRPAN
jgi:hypothetical protein